MRGSRHIAGSCVCRVFRFDVCCVVFIVSGCRKEKNERHFACVLIAFCLWLSDMCVGVCFSLIFMWHLSLLYLQYGGAIYNAGYGFTIEGSATFTSCSAEASTSSSSSSSAYAVSGGE